MNMSLFKNSNVFYTIKNVDKILKNIKDIASDENVISKITDQIITQLKEDLSKMKSKKVLTKI